MDHETLKQNAIDAINKLHSDTSVDLQTTWESLDYIKDHVSELASIVESEL